MTLMADFLLQPAAAKDGGRAAYREPDLAASQARQQDFSRMLHQQRQAADVRPAASRPADTPQANNNPPARSTEDRAKAVESRQKHDVERADNDRATTTTDNGSVQPDQAERPADALTHTEAVQEGAQDAEDNNPPAPLDPLLTQILMAHGQNEAGTELKQLPVEGEGAEQSQSSEELQADGSVSTDGPPAPVIAAGGLSAAAGTQIGLTSESQPSAGSLPNTAVQFAAMPRESGQPLSAATQSFMSSQLADQAASDSSLESAESLTDTLLSDLGEDGEALTQLVNAGGLANKELRSQDDARPGQTQIDKLDSASLSRSDTLLRSEAVQAAQGARQASGQPLNMQQPGWDKELVDKVMWMSSKNLKSADIKLNPLELGRLDIRVQVGQEHTQITFNSAHAGVRDSLDAQMHRLREMLEQQGMHNVDVDVADQSQQHQRYTAGAGGTQTGTEAGDEDDEALHGVSEVEQPQSGHAGLVSYYV